MLTSDDAICIRAVDYSETSQIVTFFTVSHGKLGAIAKGSKRPKSSFDGPIELFAQGRIVFSDSSREKLATLTEFQQAPYFANLARHLPLYNACLFAAELVNLLTRDHDPHPGLFDSFLTFLQNADQLRPAAGTHRDILAPLIVFQLQLLKEIGLFPVLNSCANCKKTFSPAWPEIYFSNPANGLLCRGCETAFPEKMRLTKSAADCLANPAAIAQAKKTTLKQVEQALVGYFTYNLGHPPKMAKHILKS